MDRLFMKKSPLNSFDILQYVKLLNIQHFRGVICKDEILSTFKKAKKFETAIINLDDHVGKGTHWTCYLKANNTAHYYDSYGDLPPPKELIKYLGTNCIIRYNHNRDQKYNTVICGHLCLKFLFDNTQKFYKK